MAIPDLWVMLFFSAIAGILDIRWFDWCSPGPNKGSLSSKCQSHDAEHQPVVQPGAGAR